MNAESILKLFEKGKIKMFGINDLLNLKENDGATLKAGKEISYKTGWQVATEGIETTDAREAMKAISGYNGNCGIWYSNGVYYIDKSKRVKTKKEALSIGRLFNQISVLNWANMNLVYC